MPGPANPGRDFAEFAWTRSWFDPAAENRDSLRIFITGLHNHDRSRIAPIRFQRSMKGHEIGSIANNLVVRDSDEVSVRIRLLDVLFQPTKGGIVCNAFLGEHATPPQVVKTHCMR